MVLAKGTIKGPVVKRASGVTEQEAYRQVIQKQREMKFSGSGTSSDPYVGITYCKHP